MKTNDLLTQFLRAATAFLAVIVMFLFNTPQVQAREYGDYNEPSQDELMEEQAKASSADDLIYSLPDETREILSQLGISSSDTDGISSLTFSQITQKLLDIAAGSSKNPIKASAAVMAILIITAMIGGMKTDSFSRPMNTVISLVSTLCLCTALITPIAGCIGKCSLIVESSAKFMLAYVPVMVTVMISSGQAMSAASYKILMMSAGETVYQVSANILVPFMNIFTGISVVSAISSRLNLSSVSDLIYKAVKWILGFTMSIFTALLTLQGIIATAGDTAGTKAVKLAINSFVPLVGGALSDAYQTVYSCMKLLKSGIGVFAIIAVAFTFVPIIIDCVLWLASVNICAAVSDVFDMKVQSGLLRSCGKVMNVMLAIILSCVVVFIISTAIILMLSK